MGMRTSEKRNLYTMKKGMIGAVLLIALVGCSKTLTRGKAKDLLMAEYHYDRAINYRVDLTREEMDEWLKRGLWKDDGLTGYGKKFFALDPTCRCLVTAAKVRPDLEITGITGSDPLKTVYYTLNWYAELPDEVRNIFEHRKLIEFSTYMRLYDDGWRVER